MMKLITNRKKFFGLLIFCCILSLFIYNNHVKVSDKSKKVHVKKLEYSDRFEGDFDFSRHIINDPVPKDTIKVVFIGSSVVYGQYLDSIEDSIPYQVERTLQSKLKNPVKVYNLAMKGDTFFEDYYIFKKCQAVIKPDLLVWGFYPGRDFKFQYPMPLGQSYWLSRPIETLRAFNFLDYLFWQSAASYCASLPKTPINNLLVEKRMLEEKINFTFKVLLKNYLEKYKSKKIALKQTEYKSIFTNYLAVRGVKIPQANNDNSVIKELGYVPNVLSDLAVKFLNECQEENIKLLLYNHPITVSFPVKNYLQNYAHNLDYMLEETRKRQIPFLRVESTWDKEKYYIDYSHFNAVGSKKMADLIAEYIISNKLIEDR